MEIQTDEALIEEIKNGSLVAFERIVKKYERPLVSFITRIVGVNESAQEIAQDSFFDIYKTIQRVDTSKRFSTYLFAVAKNKSISFLRVSKKTISLIETDSIESDEYMYEVLSQQELQDHIKSAFQKLRPEYKKVMELYYLEDLSYEEIHHRLEVPLNTVRTYLRRAKDILKKELLHSYE